MKNFFNQPLQIIYLQRTIKQKIHRFFKDQSVYFKI